MNPFFNGSQEFLVPVRLGEAYIASRFEPGLERSSTGERRQADDGTLLSRSMVSDSLGDLAAIEFRRRNIQDDGVKRRFPLNNAVERLLPGVAANNFVTG